MTNSLPNNWQVKPLGEVVRISKGKKLNSLVNSKTPTSRRFIQIDDLRNNEQLKFTEDNSGVLVNERDVLIAWDGANAGTIGFGLEGFIGSTIARLELLEENISTNYLGWLLRTKSKYLRDNCTGATIPHINKSVLTSIKIPLPPLPIQKQIAEILEKADQAKQKRKEANKLTDEFLQSLFIEMFGDPIHNQKKFPIQELKTLSIENINYGVVQPGEAISDGVPIIRVGDFEGFKISKNNLKKISFEIESAYVRSRIIGDEVLIACVGSIGKVALVDSSFVGYNIVRAVARVRVNQNLDRLYLAHYLSLPFIQEYFIQQTRTVSQPTLNIKQIAETPIILPPIELQTQFAEIVNKTEALKGKQKQSEQELENLFQSLMQKAFKGELVS